jgi:tRNA modification GTPase
MKKINLDDTICAIATAPGGGGSIGIIRLSGADSFDIAGKLFSGNINPSESHKVYYGHVLFNDVPVDEVLLLAMKGPKSYTREDVIEIHCHGGVQSVQKVLETALYCGARLAEPGEFTKRAFLNGRIDLSQAEAVLDIINAKTELSHKTAVNQLSGDLSAAVKALRQSVLAMIANIEANIDYPENDIEELSIQSIKKQTEALLEALEKLLATADAGKLIREGIETVILGRPNVGKSSIMNRLLKEDRAIVTDIPGTTRDILREYININGIPLKIIDTAGIRETSDAIEKIGVERTKKQAAEADLILVVLDASAQLTPEDIEIMEAFPDKKRIVLLNKIDLGKKAEIDVENIIEISAKENTGLDAFAEKITELFFDGQIDYQSTVTVSNARHKEALIKARQSLCNVLQTIENGLSQDFISIDLTDAYAYLGEITGDSLDEDIIDKIFSEFCLGK